MTNIIDIKSRQKKIHNPDAESAIIGGLIKDNPALTDVSNIIKDRRMDFFDNKIKVIYDAILSLNAVGKPFDKVTLIDELDRTEHLADAGGATWVSEIVRNAESEVNVREHALIVRRCSLERKAKVAIDNDDYIELGDICNVINSIRNGYTVKSSLKLIGEILKEPMAHDWLVKGWIERKQMGVLWGASESYKSLLAIEIACAIAKRLAWRGNRVKQGAVLYIAAEGGGIGIRKRFKAWQIANNINLNDAPIILREVSTILPEHTSQLIAETEQMLKEHGLTLELVILDTLSRTMQGDENSQKDLGAYQHALDAIRDKFHCATMFLHHVGHGDKTRARGASAIRCNADVELSMEQVGDNTSRLHACKIKDARKREDMFFKLTVVDLGQDDEDGEPSTSVVLTQLHDYQHQNTRDGLDGKKLEYLQALDRLETAKRDAIRESGAIPPTMLVKNTEWHSATRYLGSDSGNRATNRKELIQQGYVTKDYQDFVTLTAKGIRAVGRAENHSGGWVYVDAI